MKCISLTAFASIIAVLCAASVSAARLGNGLPWAADNRWAKNVPHGAISWYHHWEFGQVPEMPKNAEYVPTFWGPQKYNHWEKRKEEIAKLNSTHILAFNEPDIPSQANMTPSEAADLFMKELQPYAEKGINVSSPQLVYDMDWLKKFMHECGNRGCKVSFMALHWYGSYKDMDKLKNWVQNVHKEFNLPIWVTEYGITAKSNPTQEQVDNFVYKSMKWMANQDYITRAAWNGCYDIANPPDDFATPLNSMFNSGGSFRPLANIWIPALAAAGFSHNGNANGNMRRHHQMIKRTPAVKEDIEKRSSNEHEDKNRRKFVYSFGPGKNPKVDVKYPQM